MKTLLVLTLAFVASVWADETILDDMVIVEADSHRSSRQFATLHQTPYNWATLIGFGLFRGQPDLNQACVTKEGEYGQCMTINECYPERKIFQTEAKDTWIFGLYNTCKYESPRGSQVFGVCCTKYTAQVPRLPQAENEVSEEVDLAARACSPSPTNYQCTYDGRRIVNGGEVSRNSYPFMAAMMRVSSYSNRPRQFCGGSLIDESHVLTAAHCIEGFSASDVKTLRVYLGAHDIYDNQDGRSEHRVVRVIKHKDFDPKTLINDIAILTLESPATIGAKISPICLPTVDYDYLAQTVTVAGWGALSEGGSQPHKLREVDVKVLSNSECGSDYNHRIPGQIVSSMICAADTNRDSCSGDSGGPLFLKRSGFKIQLGIVSWGIGCAREDSPGVYTRVTKMMDWIRRIQNCY